MRDNRLERIELNFPGLEEQQIQSVAYLIFISYLGLLAFTVAVSYYLTRSLPEVHRALGLMDSLFALIFLVDFFIRLARAKNRRNYFRKIGWFDLITSVPGLPFLRILRTVSIFRLRRQLLATTSEEVINEAKTQIGQSTLLVVAGIGLLVLTIGVVAITYFEAPDPAANIDTAGDAFWWAIVTVSTVGYGDLYPVTTQGRVIGLFMIVVGVALFTVLTSYLATIFMSNDRALRNAAIRENQPVATPANTDVSTTPLSATSPGSQEDQTAALQALTERIAALERLISEKAELLGEPSESEQP